jgi:hypothetical protein
MRWLYPPILLGVSLGILLTPALAPAKEPLDRAQVEQHVSELVQVEDRAVLAGDRKLLETVFLPGSRAAAAALKKATQRLVYLHDWARARRIQFDGVAVHVRADPIRWLGANEVKVHGAEEARYRYHHLVGHRAESWFGLGTYHWYIMTKRDGRWYLAGDTFIDPLNQDTRLTGPAIPAVIQVRPEHRMTEPLNEGARHALAYAARYCGAAPGCGNHLRYNPDYADFNWKGGDCSNFISQVLHAGGFRETSQWSWNAETDGTGAWVNATRLSQYLRRSGRATLYASGTLPTLLKPDDGGRTPLDQLRPGDLIGYFERGRVVHFAIVAGFDEDGYPLVISHSADRFREPWDLGWDRTTRFLLFHVHYPSS